MKKSAMIVSLPTPHPQFDDREAVVIASKNSQKQMKPGALYANDAKAMMQSQQWFTLRSRAVAARFAVALAE